MSDESPLTRTDAGRALRPGEFALLARLLGHKRAPLLVGALVADTSDGGMGSIRFAPFADARSFGSILADAQFTDADGLSVSVSLSADKQGRLFELDLWKVDFSPLIRYPKPLELVIQPPQIEGSATVHIPHPA